MRFGLGWAESHKPSTGQCPVMKYHRPLMQAILFGKVNIADAVNVQMITLDQAPRGYADFDGGAASYFGVSTPTAAWRPRTPPERARASFDIAPPRHRCQPDSRRLLQDWPVDIGCRSAWRMAPPDRGFPGQRPPITTSTP